uniref:Uncharacterized protein n=1 Tax=Nitrosopumivirus cobalaminus TaxID=3158414 RepID=A0AAU7N465_9VIRU
MYGDNRTTQLILWGIPDESRDETVDASLEQATAMINARLNYEDELTDPTEIINTCCNMIAAGLIGTREGGAKSELLTQGQMMLENLVNDLPNLQNTEYTRVFYNEW